MKDQIDRELLYKIRDVLVQHGETSLLAEIHKITMRPTSMWNRMSDGVWLGTDNVSGRMMTISYRSIGYFWAVDGIAVAGREDDLDAAMEAALFAARNTGVK